MSFPRYPACKDSGVEWLGEVPEHWEVWKLAHAFTQIGSGTTPKTDNREYYEGGDIPWVNTGDLNDGELHECEKRVTELAVVDHSSLKTYPGGSLLIAMYGATIGRLGILSFAATVNQACCVLTGKSEITTKFMFYWFLGLRQQIISLATGGGQPNISQDILRSLRVSCPSRHEQTQVATFLDRETAKIDTLVAEQRRLMELLKEKRQAVISHAVTRGLDPLVPMKPSGVEWLGDVPEHWDVSRLGYESWVRARLGWKGLKAEEYVEDGFAFLSTPNIKGKEIDFEKVNFITQDRFDESPEIKISEGDVLLAKDGSTLGTVNVVRNLPRPTTVNSSIAVITPNSRLNGLFLFYLFASSYMEQTIQRTKGGMGVPHLFQADLNKFYIPLPALSEQTQIADYLDQESTKFDTLVSEAQRAIDLLQERRTALISAAVTGKIDVRSLS